MKPRLCLLTVAAFAALTNQLRADESAKKGEAEQTNPPAGRFTLVAPDWTGPINAGEFLAGIAYTNQLGIEVAPVEPPLRAHLDLPEGQGVVVVNAAAAGESAKASVRPHDVVLQIDGQQVTDPAKFNELVGGLHGKKTVLKVLRKAQPIDLQIKFPETPVYQFANQLVASNTVGWTANQYRIGVTLAPADDVLRSHVRLAEGEGLVVTDVVAAGPSAKAGLRKHDVLVQLDGKRLTTVEACDSQIQEIKDRKVAATIYRGGKEMSLEITPQLSSTAVWTVAQPFSTVLFNNGVPANQPWVGRFNLNTLQNGKFNAWQRGVRWHAGNNLNAQLFSNPAAGTWSVTAPDEATPAAEQIAKIKRQLEEMQKSLAALEAALQPATPEQPSRTDPEQPKPQKQQP